MPDFLDTARRHAARPDDWPFAPRFDPTGRWYHRLDTADGHEVWVLTWLPGQGTDLHDHGGSAGAFVVVSGVLTERVAAAAGPGGSPVRLVRNEFADGTGHRFGRHHVHQLTNDGDRPAVSVHVYGPALSTMNRYRLDGDRVSGGFAAWRAAGLPVVPSAPPPSPPLCRLPPPLEVPRERHPAPEDPAPEHLGAGPTIPPVAHARAGAADRTV